MNDKFKIVSVNELDERKKYLKDLSEAIYMELCAVLNTHIDDIKRTEKLTGSEFYEITINIAAKICSGIFVASCRTAKLKNENYKDAQQAMFDHIKFLIGHKTKQGTH